MRMTQGGQGMNRRDAIMGATGALVLGHSAPSTASATPPAQPSTRALFLTEIAQTWFKDGADHELTALSMTLVHYLAAKGISLPGGKAPTGTFQIPSGVRVVYRDDQGTTHELPQGGQTIVAQEAWFEL